MKCGIPILIAATLWPIANVQDDGRSVFGVLVEGYNRNREVFPNIDCQFEWVEGKASTREDALEGRYLGEKRIRHDHWLVNGSKVRYELMCDPAEAQEVQRKMEANIKARREGKQTEDHLAVSCLHRLFLRSDTYSLRYGPMTLAANLFSKTDHDSEGIRITPFNPDCLGPDEYSSPGRYLSEVLNGRFELRFGGTERLNDTDVLVVTVGPGLRQKFGFDPKRGYLMVHASDKSVKTGKRYYEVNVMEALECSGSRWFPTRVVSILNPDTSGPLEFRQLNVLKLDVDTVPASDQFRLQLTKGTQVSTIGKMEWLNLEKDEVTTPENLPKLHARMRQHGEAYLEMGKKEQAKTEERKAQSRRGLGLNRLTLVIMLATCAVIFAALIFFKWRASHSGTR